MLLSFSAACGVQMGEPAGPSDDFSNVGNSNGGGGGGAGGSGPQSLAISGGVPHRLNNTEYDNTVRDLLGTELRLARSFVAESAGGFDNVASALGMTPGQYENYFNAAERLAADTFADDVRRARVLPCTPTGTDGGECLGRMLTDFGLRAFRRPVTNEEVTALRAAYQRARDASETEQKAAEHVLAAMLASPAFLYRVELDPEDGTSRPLNGYELASRLSYFLWSTMPDDELFALAADDSLTELDVLRAQVDRMLADERSNALVENFAGQWLGLRDLTQHKVLTDRYPAWNDDLRNSMIAETNAFFAEFLREDRPFVDFMRAPLHFVDERLAAHYGIQGITGNQLVRIEEEFDQRRGFLGLASFLTVSSFAHRTSPTLRAKWVFEELLCSHLPPPPNNAAADLDDSEAANAAASIENVRERLELHRSNPACAGCHAAMDPIGLGLESFDAIGRARTTYENGDPIDTTGELPDGTRFSGLVEMSDIIASDPRFLRCATEKMLTYALGRAVATEAPELVDPAVTAFRNTKGTLRDLINIIVESDAFRKRTARQGS